MEQACLPVLSIRPLLFKFIREPCQLAELALELDMTKKVFQFRIGKDTSVPGRPTILHLPGHLVGRKKNNLNVRYIDIWYLRNYNPYFIINYFHIVNINKIWAEVLFAKLRFRKIQIILGNIGCIKPSNTRFCYSEYISNIIYTKLQSKEAVPNIDDTTNAILLCRIPKLFTTKVFLIAFFPKICTL